MWQSPGALTARNRRARPARARRRAGRANMLLLAHTPTHIPPLFTGHFVQRADVRFAYHYAPALQTRKHAITIVDNVRASHNGRKHTQTDLLLTQHVN